MDERRIDRFDPEWKYEELCDLYLLSVIELAFIYVIRKVSC